MSNDLHELVDNISSAAADHRWRAMGCKDATIAKSVIKNMIRKNLGIVAARANAQLIEDRLGILLGNGKAAAERRRGAEEMSKKAHEEYVTFHMRLKREDARIIAVHIDVSIVRNDTKIS